MAAEFSLIADLGAAVLEGPCWDARRGVLWCVDIYGQAVLRLDPRDDSLARFALPEVCGSLALCRSGAILVAQRASVVKLDPESGRVTPFVDLPEEPPGNRLNDGKVGPDGCFWVGSMDDRPEKAPNGMLWRVTPEGRAEKKREGITVSNGLAWSPDGRTIWHSDSSASRVDIAEFDPATGRAGAWRTAITFDETMGRPDGAATDAEGNYWSAGVFGAALHVISPTGALRRSLPFPVAGPTMPCFAGPDLTTLYVTSLARNQPALPRGSGGLFRAAGLPRGAPVPPFAD